MNAASVFCATCGAANPPDAPTCFACGNPPLVAAPQTPGSGAAGAFASRSLLRQRYRLLAQIGKGGFGAVYQAEDTELGNRKVAVKEMIQRGLTPEEVQEATQAFRNEALLLAGLTHPNLPRIYEQFSEDGRWYLVMDFIEGETLEDHVSHAPGKRLPVQEVLKIGVQLCMVLEFLHTRQPPIIFRDLKPANIMVAPSGDICLIDFGIARHFKPSQTKDTVAFGSAGYAAPEQYGKAQTTTQSDIYSLGATLHHLLSGSDPSDTPFLFAPLHVAEPEGLEKLIMQMLETDQSRRPASMAVIKQDLQRMADALATGRKQQRPMVFPTLASPKIATPPQPTPVPAAPKSMQPLLTYKGHTDRINTLAWSPDGSCLAAGGMGKTVEVWEVKTGKHLLTYSGHKGSMFGNAAISALAWSPSGEWIASASVAATVQVWDVTTTELRCTYRGGQFGYHGGVAWSPDEKRIASTSESATIDIWMAANGRQNLLLNGHKGTVNAVAWSPDGKLLASGGSDQTVRVWEVGTGKEAQVYFHRKGEVDAIAWSPDSTYIASAGEDHVVHVWQAR